MKEESTAQPFWSQDSRLHCSRGQAVTDAFVKKTWFYCKEGEGQTEILLLLDNFRFL